MTLTAQYIVSVWYELNRELTGESSSDELAAISANLVDMTGFREPQIHHIRYITTQDKSSTKVFYFNAIT